MNAFELKYLSNNQLDQLLKESVIKEREILTVILEHIVEVDRRKLYLTFAYPNLFEYLTKHIGYSAGSAHRRIDAARLSKEVPEVISKLEDGSLNLAQVGLLQKSVRQCQFENKAKVALQTKKRIVEAISKKSFNESQVLVNQSLNISTKELPKITHQQNESVRFEVTLTKSQWDKLVRMRELLSNSLPNGTWDQVLEYISDKVIVQKSPKAERTTEAKKTNKAKRKTVSKNETQNDNRSSKVDKLEVRKARTPLAKSVRDHVLKRDECCQYQDQQTGKVCGSKWHLHIDHIQPVWANGSNNIKNLRILCANHNLEIYRQQAGVFQRV